MTEDRPVAPLYNRIYGQVVYWITLSTCVICLIGIIISVLRPEDTALNPYFTFAMIFEGVSGPEIWKILHGSIPSIHSLWWNELFTGDGLIIFGLTLGTTVVIWGLIPTIYAFARNGVWGYAVLSLIIIGMILFSASGIMKLEPPEPRRDNDTQPSAEQVSSGWNSGSLTCPTTRSLT